MKLNVMFTIAAVFLILIGILSFVSQAVPALGVTDTSAAFSSMVIGVMAVSFAVIAWLVRNADASKTRDSLVLGFTLLFALWALVSIYGTFIDMPSNNISWVIGLIQGLIAVGFFMAGKASMSKNAS